MKTNNYLRAIDRRLGNPVNTFAVVNDISWQVYRADVAPHLSRWTFLRELFRYYLLKIGLAAAYAGVRLRQVFGLRISDDEMLDFELDVTVSHDTKDDHLSQRV